MNQRQKKEQKIKKVSFNQFIFPIVLLVVFYGLSFIFAPDSPKNNEFSYQPDNVEVVVEDEINGSQLPKSEDNQNLDMSKKLGPATVGEIMGGSSSEEFYQTPSIEKLLEGKEIEIGN